MNKTRIKNFAVWARNKLIADITYKAGLIGVSEKGIAQPLPQSSEDLQFFDIGTKDYAQVTGADIEQRNALVRAIQEKESTSDYQTAFKAIIEEAAYIWFNRLIAIRFMEVNDYLPSRIRVLSSENGNKPEPDIVTCPFDSKLPFTQKEQDAVMRLKDENKLDELFRILFIKQCHALHEVLPGLFDADSMGSANCYLELLLTISFIDKDGVVWRLVHDIPEKDFRIRTSEDDERQKVENIPEEDMPAGQVEIIGWLYQYYNTEPKDQVFANLKKNIKVSKDNIPAATQLFTPDWIVRYMVENSLGRLWVEGHPNDELKASWKYYLEEAEQEPQVQTQLAEIRKGYAALRPEEIRVIDPCMGSGHILVYLFDVLMQIYESRGWSRREAVQSIVTHNLWGLDIDERAAQLAYFAVMMKACQYDRRFLRRGIQPHVYAIAESNGVDSYTLDYFCKGDVGLKKAMNTIVEELHDAKEYGSLLTVTPQDWSAVYARFDEIEEEINFSKEAALALRPLVQTAQALSQKYHTVCTNPPYMGSSNMGGKLSDYVKQNYPDSKSDLFAVFIECCGKMTRLGGYQAMITQHAWMFLSSFEKLRGKLLLTDTVNMAHLGARAFEEIGGEVVQTTSFVLRKSHTPGCKGVYCRLIEPTTQQGKEEMFLAGENRYAAAQDNFSKIPGSPVAYWVSPQMFRTFEIGTPVSDISKGRSGQNTGDNNRFLRLWYEVNCCLVGWNLPDDYDGIQFKWIPYNKGGEYRRWYGNYQYVINWKNDGEEIKEYAVIRNGGKHWSRYIQNLDCLYKEGITWSIVTASAFSMRYLPKGFICDNAGCSIFPEHSINSYLLALFNTKYANIVLNIVNPTINYQPGNIGTVPYIYSDIYANRVDELVTINKTISQSDWDSFETSWDFQRHPLVPSANQKQEQLDSQFANERMKKFGLISWHYENWERECEVRFQQLKTNEEELNRIFIDIYGLQDELTPEVEDKDVTVRRTDLGRDVRSLISYAVGCMFGRYSLDVDGLAYAGGDFDSVYRKDRLVDEQGNAITFGGIQLAVSRDYTQVNVNGEWRDASFAVDADNCIPITDEPYFEDDIVSRFVEFVRVVYGAATLEENLSFIAQALGNRGNSSREVIRNYFLNDFMKDHMKIYQKRPIYWLFDSGRQNGFKALVYMHRWNADTVGNLRVEYLHRTQRVYEKEIERMQDTIAQSKDSRDVARATKRREKLTKQLKETRDYDTKIAHVALSRVDIDLDDGVKVNYEKVQKGPDGKSLGILAKM